MSEFKIKLARIEVFEEGEQGKQVCAVFQIERGPIGFHIPIYLQGRDFDDTEVVQAPRIRFTGCSQTSPTRAKYGSFRLLNSNVFLR
jgi:hypothetical protein